MLRLLRKLGLGSKCYGVGLFLFILNVSMMHKNESVCLKRSLEKSFLLGNTDLCGGGHTQNSAHFRFNFDALEDDTDCFTIDTKKFQEMTTFFNFYFHSVANPYFSFKTMCFKVLLRNDESTAELSCNYCFGFFTCLQSL